MVLFAVTLGVGSRLFAKKSSVTPDNLVATCAGAPDRPEYTVTNRFPIDNRLFAIFLSGKLRG